MSKKEHLKKEEVMTWDPYEAFRSITLENGLTIHALQMDKPWQRINFMLHSGSAQDPVGSEGTAHFVEHLLSQNAPISCDSLKDYFREKGGSIMLGATSYWYTQYRIFIPADDAVLEQSLSYLGAMLFKATLENDIERERGVILNEFRKKYPFSFAYEHKMKTHSILFKGTAIERVLDALGTPQTISTITKEELQAFYNMQYTPANMSIVAVGRYSLEQLVAVFSRSVFAEERAGVRATIAPLKLLPLLEEHRQVVNITKYISSAEAMTNGGYECHLRLPMEISQRAIGLFCDMLRDLLDAEIRQKKAWTYQITITYSLYFQFYKIGIECQSLALEGIDVIDDMVNDIVSSLPLHEEAFKKARHSALASIPMTDQNGRSIFDEASSDIVFFGKVISLEQYRIELESITFADVCSIVSYWKSENLWTVITRP